MSPTLFSSIRPAVRSLAVRPGFALAAVAILALGIGVNTAMFSIVDTTLLRPLPYADAHRLAILWKTIPAEGETEGFVSYPDFEDWRNETTSFDDLTAFWAFANGNVNLTGGLEPERVPVARVMAGYFELLGIPPQFGRTFRAEENVLGNHRRAILSHALWQRQFGGDSTIVGQPVHVNGFPYTVVGIMPRTFHPVGSLVLGDEVALWRPLVPADNQTGGRGARNLRVVGRLRAGVTIEEAQTELDGIAARLATAYPETNAGSGVRIVPLQEQIVHSARPALLALWFSVGIVLLIACVNVANLLVVRGTAQKKQTVIRMALGARRRTVVFTLLAESILLGATGGVLGLVLAAGALTAVTTFGPADVPFLLDVRLDVRAFAFTSLLAVGTGVFFGLAPALHFSKLDLGEVLREGGHRSAGTTYRSMANVLVVSEMALSTVLLVAAGLFLRSYQRLSTVDPGFETENLLTLQLELPMATTYPTQEERDIFFATLADRLRAHPDVRRASVTNAPPMGEGELMAGVSVGGQPARVDDPRAHLQLIDPEYFATMGIPVLQGRNISGNDHRTAPRVAVLSRSLADALWPGGNPVGQQLRLSWGPSAEVVGVVPDVRVNSLDTDPRPIVYWPTLQMTYNFATVILGTTVDPVSVVPRVRDEIRQMDANLPVYNIETVRGLVAGSVARERFQTSVIAGFALMAVALALIGIYSVVSYSVRQRTTEIGIRMALGADARATTLLMLREGATLIVPGAIIGLLAAAVLGRLVESLLFGITPFDLASFVSAPLLLAGAALAATFVPARRAGRVDPLVALRAE